MNILHTRPITFSPEELDKSRDKSKLIRIYTFNMDLNKELKGGKMEEKKTLMQSKTRRSESNYIFILTTQGSLRWCSK